VLKAEDQSALLGILGNEGLLCVGDYLAAYETAARYGAGIAAAVARPSDTSQVSAVVQYCVSKGLPFIPQSGNTGLVLGSTPDNSGAQIVLSLDRLRSPPQIDVANRSVTVAAGTRLSELNGCLEPHDLFLPIDLSADPMLGGMVATNTGGARFIKYGDMRRHVLGLEVVLPDRQGTTLALSRGLRKDNSHLDLRHLFIGSCGALGIITSAILEVHPRPQQTAAALVIPSADSTVMEILRKFETDAGDTLTAFEGISESAMRRTFAHIPSLRNPFGPAIPPYALLIELASSTRHRPGERSLEDFLQMLVMEMADRPEPLVTDAIFGDPAPFWALRHALSEGLRASGRIVGLDLSFHRNDVMRFRRVAIERLNEAFPDYEVCDFGHIADGGVHFNLVTRSNQPEDTTSSATRLRDYVLTLAVDEFGGSFSGEHGVGRSNQAAYDKFTPPSIQHYAGAISSLFSTAPAAAVRFGPRPLIGESNDQ
jgi:FAD/FMN-containing dehydrogenase